jgi:hypothetical protein
MSLYRLVPNHVWEKIVEQTGKYKYTKHFHGVAIVNQEEEKARFDNEVEKVFSPSEREEKKDWNLYFTISDKNIHGSIVITQDRIKYVKLHMKVEQREKNGAMLNSLVPSCELITNGPQKFENREVDHTVQYKSFNELSTLAYERIKGYDHFEYLGGPNCHTFCEDFIQKDLELSMRRDQKSDRWLEIVKHLKSMVQVNLMEMCHS